MRHRRDPAFPATTAETLFHGALLGIGLVVFALVGLVVISTILF